MVRHPVEPHLHAQLMGTRDEGLQVSNSTIVGVDGTEIHGGVGAVHRGTTRIDGHEPEDIDAQRVEAVESLLRCLERALGSEGTDIHLIDDAVGIAQGLCAIDCKALGTLSTGSEQEYQREK